MKALVQTVRPALGSLAVLTIVCGVVYPALMTVAGHVIPHPRPASLVGQPFDDPAYAWGRPSAVAYNAMTSGGGNQGPTGAVDARGTLGPNPALVDAVKQRIAALRAADPTATQMVPIDLVTASASGLDPDISPAAAYFQAPRIARLRAVPLDTVMAIIDGVVEERTFGILGERRVNVVRLNRALDREVPRPR